MDLAPAANGVTLAGWLHLDHVGAQVREEPRAERAGDEVPKLEHAQTRQRALLARVGGMAGVAEEFVGMNLLP